VAKHLDVAAYWKDVAPRLDAHINGQRNRDVEDFVAYSLALYSFVQENFVAEATQNQSLLKHTGIMLVHVHDVLRGLTVAQVHLSPVTSAALLRIALEVRCNQLFIIKSPDPAKYADRFERYAGIERLLREEYAPPGTPSLLSPAEEQRIRTTCTEWFNNKGKVQVKHWTAEEKFKSLKSLADAVGLSDEYLKVYAIGSKFVHGSSLLENLYSRNGRMGALSNPRLCSQLSTLAASHGVHMIREAAAFFGVPSFDDDYLVWQAKAARCFQLLEQQ
jgi:hypothetical protein